MRNPPLYENGFAISRDLTPSLVRIDKLKPLGRQTRRHPQRQLDKLAASLKEFGFVIPVLIDLDGQVVGGWGLVLAARQLGLAQVPAVTITDLTEAKLRLLRLALNRLGEDSDWDVGALTLEFADVFELTADLDLRISGFEMAEIDTLRAAADDDEDDMPVIDHRSPAITKPGDIWVLDQHRIVCGDPLLGDTYDLLLEGEAAQLVFADTYSLPIAEQVDGPARTMQSGIAMPSTETSPSEREAFLSTAFGHVAHHAGDGSLHLIFVDWRHVKELLGATARLYSEMKDLCVWNKSAAGKGSLYGAKHELIFVFKKGSAPHISNIAHDAVGRCRGNVWDYAAKTTKIKRAKAKSLLHPIVKPVALIADAMRDCSDVNGLVLDPFGGVGTTLIAAEKTGRRARLIEIEPPLVDCTVRRWQLVTGKAAVHRRTGQPFGAKDLTPETMKRLNAMLPAQARERTMSDDSDGKKVGYKKPPLHSRWKPGQSPNPRGRTKGALNLKTEFKRLMEAPITVNEKGKPKKISAVRATLFRLLEKALKGDVRCMALFLEYAHLFGGLASDPPSDISHNEQAILDAFRDEILAEAAKDKSPNPEDEDIK